MSCLLCLLRIVTPLLVMVIFASSTVHHATGQPSPLPGPAALPGPAGPPAATTGVVFVQFPKDEGGVTTTLYPLGSDDNMPVLPQAVPLYSQPDPPRCQTDAVHASPNGAALLLQYNCEDTLFARLLNLNSPDAVTLLNQGYFMNWSPDGLLAPHCRRCRLDVDAIRDACSSQPSRNLPHPAWLSAPIP